MREGLRVGSEGSEFRNRRKIILFKRESKFCGSLEALRGKFIKMTIRIFKRMMNIASSVALKSQISHRLVKEINLERLSIVHRSIIRLRRVHSDTAETTVKGLRQVRIDLSAPPFATCFASLLLRTGTGIKCTSRGIFQCCIGPLGVHCTCRRHIWS